MRALVVTAVALCVALPAAATEGEQPEHHFVTGAKVVELTSISHGHASAHWGGGAFFEIIVVPHRLELDLSVAFLEAHGVLVPIDLVAKYPVHLTEELEAFVGVGPVINIYAASADDHGDHGDEAPGVETFFGFSTVLGAYYWFHAELGALAQVNYNGIWEHDDYVSEIGGAIGVAYRF